jgi:hypothetical protein
MKDENLAQLKMVYDELWSDANIMIKVLNGYLSSVR